MADINYVIESAEIETASAEEGVEGKFPDHRRFASGSKVSNEGPIRDLETEGIYLYMSF